MNKKILIIILGILILLLSGCGNEQTKDIYILFTNDVSSALDGQVGYAGVKGYKDYLKNENEYVALVDAGDFFDGNISNLSKGEAIVEIMNAVGYDVVTLGNQEFSIGLDALKKNISDSDFDYVSCNMRYTGLEEDLLKDVVKPFVIKKFGTTKVAFIGVTTPEILVEGKPSYEAILQDGELIYDFYEGNEGQDLYDQVQKTVDKIGNKADYVIILSHLGSNSVREGFSSYDLIENTTGIDVVIDGHSHTVISGEAVYNKNGDMVVLTSTGEKLQNLGILTLHTDHSCSTVLLPSVYEKDSQIEELVAEIYARFGS